MVDQKKVLGALLWAALRFAKANRVIGGIWLVGWFALNFKAREIVLMRCIPEQDNVTLARTDVVVYELHRCIDGPNRHRNDSDRDDEQHEAGQRFLKFML